MTDINKLFKTEGSEEQIFDWLINNKDNKTFSNNLKRFLNLLLDHEDLYIIDEVLKEFNIDVKDTKDKQMGVLFIRYHCLNEDPEKALDIYLKLDKKNKRKRHLTIIILTLINLKKHENAYSLFVSELINEYPIDSEDLVMFYKTEYIYEVAKAAVGFDIILPESTIQKENQVKPHKDLQKFKLTKDEKTALLNSIKDQFAKKKKTKLYDEFKENIKKKDVVVDGANILYYGERVINQNSYIRLDNMMKELEKMGKSFTVYLHERHFNIKKWKNTEIDRILKKWKEKGVFYKTPRTFNDDWYAIIAALVSDAMVLTNDNFKDHVFGAFGVQRNGVNVFRRWKDEYGIYYEFKNNNNVIEMKYPKEFSQEVQMIDGDVYVPLSNGNWVNF